jgi:hypothetical protein
MLENVDGLSVSSIVAVATANWKKSALMNMVAVRILPIALPLLMRIMKQITIATMLTWKWVLTPTLAVTISTAN